MPRFVIVVVEHSGETHYLRQGHDDGPVAVYTSRRQADADAAFWRDGLGDEVQTVYVSVAPRELLRFT